MLYLFLQHLILHKKEAQKVNQCFLNLFRMGVEGRSGWGKKAPATSFSSVTSTNVRISFKTFWFLVLTLLTDWCKISSLYLELVPNYWTWTKITPQKKRCFWSNSYKFEVLITSLIQMPELPNFGHMTTSIM